MVVSLRQISEIVNEFYSNEKQFRKRVLELAESIDDAIAKHGVVVHTDESGESAVIYAYEVDGCGIFLI